MNKIIMLATVVVLSGCTDATMSKFASLGSSAHIMCYSGTKLIYSGYSSGKVKSEANSDGYYFVDKEDGRLKEVAGNCVIDYGAE